MNSSVKLILILLIWSLTITEAADTVKISITPGKHWNHSFKVGFFTINTTPQFALWLADSSGNYLTTLSVTEKSARYGYSGARKTSRPSALPIWAHGRGEKSDNGNFMPSKKAPLSDAETSASPMADTVLTCFIADSLKNQKLLLRMEINGSMDFNEYFTKKADKEDPGYNNGVNGQPSLLYETVLTPDMNLPASFELMGHGEPAGRDGSINKNLSNLSTGLKLINNISVTERSK